MQNVLTESEIVSSCSLGYGLIGIDGDGTTAQFKIHCFGSQFINNRKLLANAREKMRWLVQLQSKISCESLLKILDIDESGSQLLTEYYDMTLFDFIHNPESAIDKWEAGGFAQQLIAGLKSFHDVGVCGLGLNPKRIAVVITKAAPGRRLLQLKLMPLAWLGIFEYAESSLDDVAYELAYVSVENTETEEDLKRNDVFSLGRIINELATGVQPFQGRSVAAMYQDISIDRIPSVYCGNDELLHHVIIGCLQHEPSNRATTEELLDTLAGKMRMHKITTPEKSKWIVFKIEHATYLSGKFDAEMLKKSRERADFCFALRWHLMGYHSVCVWLKDHATRSLTEELHQFLIADGPPLNTLGVALACQTMSRDIRKEGLVGCVSFAKLNHIDTFVDSVCTLLAKQYFAFGTNVHIDSSINNDWEPLKTPSLFEVFKGTEYAIYKNIGKELVLKTMANVKKFGLEHQATARESAASGFFRRFLEQKVGSNGEKRAEIVAKFIISHIIEGKKLTDKNIVDAVTARFRSRSASESALADIAPSDRDSQMSATEAEAEHHEGPVFDDAAMMDEQVLTNRPQTAFSTDTC